MNTIQCGRQQPVVTDRSMRLKKIFPYGGHSYEYLCRDF
jgi:hypothetical protein